MGRWSGYPLRGVAAENAAKTRCIRDHPLDDPANVYTWTDQHGRHRQCRRCRLDAQRRRAAAASPRTRPEDSGVG